MKILYLDLNIRYHNPTRNLVPSLLNIENDVYIYGPGYSSDEVLEEGVEKFYDKHGPFDFVCSNEHITVFFPEKLSEYKYEDGLNENFYFNFNYNEKYLKNMCEFYKNVKDVKKLLFLLEFDKYWLPQSRLDILLELDAYIIGYGTNHAIKKEDCPYVHNESFYNEVNDKWYDFVNSYEKIIQLVHFVDNSEFEWSNLNNRKYESSVLGTGYWSRQIAVKELTKNEVRLPGKFNHMNKIFDILRRMGYNANSTRLGIYLNNKFFNNMIEDSISSYTCGSGNMQPLRKFFEIPSKGALLMCLPFVGFNDLGFENNKNCITLNQPDEIMDAINRIKNDMEWANEIAANGRKMIFQKHSISARAGQLQDALHSISDNKFKTSYWKEGSFIIEEN